MIIGIGNDIVELSRINNVLDRYNSYFLSKYFTDEEVANAHQIPTQFSQKIAGAWAVKEAMAKALGTGIRDGIKMRDIVLVRQENGRPTVKLCNKAHEVAQDLSVNGMYSTWVSISHDVGIVWAMVILETQ